MNATDLLAIDISNTPRVVPCNSPMGVLSTVVKANLDHGLKRIAALKATPAQSEKVADLAVRIISEKTGERYEEVMDAVIDGMARFYPRCTDATRKIMCAITLVCSAYCVRDHGIWLEQPGAEMAERVLRAGLELR